LLFLGHISSAALPGHEPQPQKPGRPNAPDVGDDISQKLPVDFRFHQVNVPLFGDLNDPSVLATLSHTVRGIANLCSDHLDPHHTQRIVPVDRTRFDTCGSQVLSGLSIVVRESLSPTWMGPSDVRTLRINPYESRVSSEQLMYHHYRVFIWENFCKRCPITPTANELGATKPPVSATSIECYTAILSRIVTRGCGSKVPRDSAREPWRGVGFTPSPSDSNVESPHHPEGNRVNSDPHIGVGLFTLLELDDDAHLMSGSGTNPLRALNRHHLPDGSSEGAPLWVLGAIESLTHGKSNSTVAKVDASPSTDPDESSATDVEASNGRMSHVS